MIDKRGVARLLLVFFIGALSAFASRAQAQTGTDSVHIAQPMKGSMLPDSTGVPKHIIETPLALRKGIFSWRDSVIIPKRSAFYSLILPGAGQVNNGDYWKVPIIYAGLAVSTYFIITNNNAYNDARREYAFRIDNPAAVLIPNKYDGWTMTQVGQDRDYYKRLLDISVLASVAIYGLQVVEANAAAHLKGFDISDDISLRFHPTVIPVPWGIQPGFMVAFNFK